MKKIILILAFCLLSLSLTAQDRIVVLPFSGGDELESDTLTQVFGTELAKLGNFRIAFLRTASNNGIEEQKWLTDGDTIVELGKGANAKYVISGHIQTLGSRKMILTSMLDVETFRQIAGDYYEYDDLDEARAYLPTLAEKLISKTNKDYSEIPILAILPFDGVDENNTDILIQLLTIELINSEKYAVVSRATTIENVMTEQNIQISEIFNSETITKLGEATNASYVLTGSLSSLGSDNLMNVQIINVLSLETENIATVEYKTIEDGANRMVELSYELTNVEGEKSKEEENLIAEQEEEKPKKGEKSKEEEKPKQKGKFIDSQIPKNVLGISGSFVYGPKVITLENNFTGGINLFGSWGFLPFMFVGGDIGFYFPDENAIFTSVVTTGFNLTLFKILRPYTFVGLGGFISFNKLYDLEYKGGFMARAAAGIDILLGNFDDIGFVINLEYSFDFFYNVGFVDRCSLGVGLHFGN